MTRKIAKRIGMAAGALIVLAQMAGPSAAQVPQSQIDRLGQDLTPLGAEKAGNGEGSIPAWTGGLSEPPAGLGFVAGEHYKDPFKSDPVLFTVTGVNAAQYDAALTPGQKAMLAQYPNYKLNVYQSRRTCANSEASYLQAKKNAQVGALAQGGNGVSGSVLTTPFPIPNNALEIAWNHLLRNRAFKIVAQSVNVAPTADGSYTPIVVQTDTIINYSNPAVTRTEELDNISVYILFNTIAPARSAGNVLLVHETLNQAKGARKAWQYSPGTRRVRRAPNIAYDNPGTNSDGLSTSDSFDMYNGAPDRYDWTVVGKSERFAVNNAYRMAEADVGYQDVVQPGHINQDLVRYERQRVWQIRASLRPQTRHIYQRRDLYLNEDSWSIVAGDLYDARGELWRVQESWSTVAYDVPVCENTGGVVYDLAVGRYLAGGLRSQEAAINYDAAELQLERYTPAEIRRIGVR